MTPDLSRCRLKTFFMPLEKARGKFLAVAGQEPCIADTPEAAWAWVATTYPEDDGAMVQYIRPETGPRIQADKR